MVRGDIYAYMSEQDIMDKFDFESLKQTEVICRPYYADRAQILIDKLSPLSSDIPTVIQQAIWKLSIVNFTAKRLRAYNLTEATQKEKIDNLTIKAKFLDPSTWEGVTFDDTDDSVEIDWVLMVEAAELFELHSLAKALSDKILLRKEIAEIKYHNWDEHIKRCVSMEIDPKEYTEEEAKKMEELISDYKGSMSNA